MTHGALKQFPLPLKQLLNFERAVRNEPQRGILFSLSDYLELVDSTGRLIHADKRGHITAQQPPILKRLGLTTEEWLVEATEFENRYQANRRDHLDRRRSAAFFIIKRAVRSPVTLPSLLTGVSFSACLSLVYFGLDQFGLRTKRMRRYFRWTKNRDGK